MPTTPEEEKSLEAFHDEVIDRLFLLNAKRAKEEKLNGKSAKGTKQMSKSKIEKAKPTAQLGLLGEESN